jgi:plasmid stability protein
MVRVGASAAPAFDVLSACKYHFPMSTMIQIRNVPQALHRRLKSRAALEGKSLSDYLLDEIREAAERPTLAEMHARLESREAASPMPEPALAVRAERDRA